MLIFPRKRMNPAFEMGLPAGSFSVCHESGWITKELFIIWFKHFIEFVGASQDRKILLVLDGHASHTKNIELIDLARKHGVILLCFPPHCSHRLQPLDVSFMKPLSNYYEDEVRKFLRSNPGKVATLHHLSQLFGAAYTRAATMSNAVNGFRKTGIYPTDMHVFSDDDFLPSATTEIELSTVEPGPRMEPTPGPSSELTPCPSTETTPGRSTEPTPGPSTEHTPGPSTESSPSTPRPLNRSSTPGSLDSSSCFPTNTPHDLLPIPHVGSQTKKRVSRKRGGTAILTSSPYKKTLVDAENAKENKVSVKKSRGRPKKNPDAKKRFLIR